MKRGLIGVFIIGIVLLLSLSFVSAGFWEWIFGGDVQLQPVVDEYFEFGFSDATPLVGDWDGSGDSNIGVFDIADDWITVDWLLDSSGDGQFTEGDIGYTHLYQQESTPIVGHWNEDGVEDVGVVLIMGVAPNQFLSWRLDMNNNGIWESGVDKEISFGWSSATPVVGDWNNDGIDDIGLFDSGIFYLDENGNNLLEATENFVFSSVNAKPVVGNWGPDGSDWIGIFENGGWYLDSDRSTVWEEGVDTVIAFGEPTDTPIVGDWDGKGSDKVGVARLNVEGGYWEWYLDTDGDGVWREPSCIDADGDGYCEDVDCDEGDDLINPGATEICTGGVDEDCDDGQPTGGIDCLDDDCTSECATNECEAAGNLCTSDANGCGHFPEVTSLGCGLDLPNDICCSELPECGDGYCEDYEYTTDNCPADCALTCNDEDGGADKYYISGVVNVLLNGVPFDVDNIGDRTDHCDGTVTNQLTEYGCVAGEVLNEDYSCPNGCTDGACIAGGVATPFNFKTNTDYLSVEASLEESNDEIAFLYGGGINFEGKGVSDTEELITSIDGTNLMYDLGTANYFVASWTDVGVAESYLMRVVHFENNGTDDIADVQYKRVGAWVDVTDGTDVIDGGIVTVGVNGNLELTIDQISDTTTTVRISPGTGVVFSKLYDKNRNYIDLDTTTSFPRPVYNLNVYDWFDNVMGSYSAYWELGEIKLEASVPEVCDDEIDNDFNGLTDCADPTCVATLICLSTASCTDTDGGRSYFESGSINIVEGETSLPVIDRCLYELVEEGAPLLDDLITAGVITATDLTSDAMILEAYCPVGLLEMPEVPEVLVSYECRYGCVEGACGIPSRGFVCEGLTVNGPDIQPKTRVNATSYCNPLTLEYADMVATEGACEGDYECLTNVCIESVCTSLRQQLQEQKNLLEKIWCVIQAIFTDKDIADCSLED